MLANSIPRPINIALMVLSVIGVLLWTMCTYIGLFFVSGGSLGISIPLGIAVGGLMAYFLYLMRRYTGFVMQRYRTEDATKYQWTFFALYLVVALGSALFVMKSVAVTTTIKNEYRTVALEDLRRLYNLVDSTAPDGSYPKYVNMEVDRYRSGNGDKEASTLDFESQQLRQRLTENSGFNNMRAEIVEFWQLADYTVRNWELWYLPSTVNTFYERETVWVDSLVNGAEKGNYDIYATLHTPFTPNYKSQANLYHSFRSINGNDFSGWCIPVVLILQFLILGSWLSMLGSGPRRPDGVNNAPQWNGAGFDAGNDAWSAGHTWNPDE